MADGTLPINAACKFSGLSRSRLYELIAERELSTVKVGRRTLIPKRSLVELLARGLQEPQR
ncbi:MAG: helix-turn-helix domain-containing protein [Myxococcales bacterium]|nr:helix-turn-helix domain-containing protein [Myxococcales bacterium]